MYRSVRSSVLLHVIDERRGPHSIVFTRPKILLREGCPRDLTYGMLNPYKTLSLGAVLHFTFHKRAHFTRVSDVLLGFMRKSWNASL